MAATFGQLIDALKTGNFCGLELVRLKINGEYTEKFPADVCSWRGSYELGCLVPGSGSRGHLPAMSVRETVQLLEWAISGVIFQGWKGGDYEFDRDTAVWFGHEGVYDEIAVQGIEMHEGIVYVVVADEEYV